MPKKRRPDGYYEQKFDELHDEGRIGRGGRIKPLDPVLGIAKEPIKCDPGVVIDVRNAAKRRDEMHNTEHGDECPLCENGTVEHTETEIKCRGECGCMVLKPNPPRTFRNTNAVLIKYDDVIEACDGEVFKASFVPSDGKIVEMAVNKHPIDSHLEACFDKNKDSYEWDNEVDKLVCSVSPESLAVLVRRLFDLDDCSEIGEAILTALGFNENGER